jgi:hypothetical protein
MNKKRVPATIIAESTGKLPSLTYDWIHILNVCSNAIKKDIEYVILPVMEFPSTKKNKAKIIKENNAPSGLIMKFDRTALEKYYPYAAAKFNANELLMFATKKFNEMTEEQVEQYLEKHNAN